MYDLPSQLVREMGTERQLHDFPDEDGYAAADVKVAVGQDEETGDAELILSGVIAVGTELLAVAKLNAFRTAVLAAEGFNANSRIRNQIDKGYLNADDITGDNVFTALTLEKISQN
jgi:hypothetical protein